MHALATPASAAMNKHGEWPFKAHAISLARL